MDDILDLLYILFEGIRDLARFLFEFVRDLLNAPRFDDPNYWCGASMAVIVLAVAWWFIDKILKAWALIQNFFRPTASPATRPGPSGADRMVGCGEGVFRLIAIVVLFIVLVVAFSVLRF